MNKEELRKKALELRRGIPETVRQEKSAKIMNHLESLPLFKKASKVLFYYTNQEEVDVLPLIDRWKVKKEIYLPTLMKGDIFKATKMEEGMPLIKNIYRIPEPENTSEATDLDLILVPGVAFDENGARLGMGKGYYDRFLKTQKGVFKIGLAYIEQILAGIPQNAYDENVDMIITDKRIIEIK